MFWIIVGQKSLLQIFVCGLSSHSLELHSVLRSGNNEYFQGNKKEH